MRSAHLCSHFKGSVDRDTIYSMKLQVGQTVFSNLPTLAHVMSHVPIDHDSSLKRYSGSQRDDLIVALSLFASSDGGIDTQSTCFVQEEGCFKHQHRDYRRKRYVFFRITNRTPNVLEHHIEENDPVMLLEPTTMVWEVLPVFALKRGGAQALLCNESILHTVDMWKLFREFGKQMISDFVDDDVLYHHDFHRAKAIPHANLAMARSLGLLYVALRSGQHTGIPGSGFFYIPPNHVELLNNARALEKVRLCQQRQHQGNSNGYCAFGINVDALGHLQTVIVAKNCKPMWRAVNRSKEIPSMSVVDCLNPLNATGWACRSWESKLGRNNKPIVRRQRFATLQAKECFVFVEWLHVNIWYLRILLSFHQVVWIAWLFHTTLSLKCTSACWVF